MEKLRVSARKKLRIEPKESLDNLMALGQKMNTNLIFSRRGAGFFLILSRENTVISKS